MKSFDNFDREFRKLNNKKISKKDKKIISEDQKLDSKAKKAFKNRKQNIRDEELWDEMEDYKF